MNEENKKIIREKFETLPKAIQEMVMSAYYEETIFGLGEQYSLTAEQTDNLFKETTAVMMGFENTANFEQALEKESGIEPIKIKEIAKNIQEKIFYKVQESLDLISLNHEDTPEMQDLDTRFDRLPQNIQEVVEKSNYQALLYEISIAHKLSVTQMGTLDTITTDLIVGSIHPDEFKKVVIKKIGLPEEESTTLVNEINEKVFKKIRGQLMALTGAGVTPPEPQIQTPKEDLDTLKSHGIEIAEKPPTIQVDLLAVPKAQLLQAGKLEIPAPKTELHPLLTQKMSVPVQSTSVKNQYELKSTSEKTVETKNPPVQPPKITSYPTKADPYREIPE